ncbi:uncharacterized protein LOC133927645 [Phragmites australis]|uniref:uncharacterized protein LOC133927645 n=1 Tax=Phragmites australis TaxID=29695 RepID=UPI002D77B874|nr:uncharacterized protein LOC133927645 [Phragmites australis]
MAAPADSLDASTQAALDATTVAAGAAAAAAISPDTPAASLADTIAAATADAVRAVFASLSAPALTSPAAPPTHASAPTLAAPLQPAIPPRGSLPEAATLSVDPGDDATASLHAQAVAVLNVKTLVPVTLDLAAANYTKWRGLFLVILGKYALADHVLSDAYHPDRTDWARMDCVVLTWLYGSISVELLEIVMSASSTACIVWRDLEHQFLGNLEQRALNLSAEFHCFVQGDLSVTDYCRRLKRMADGLADLGEPVTDRTIVLMLLKGLNERFCHLQTILPLQKPFPTFVEARSQLLLEEITRDSRSSGASTAFLAAGSSSAGANRGSTPGGGPAPPPVHAAGFGSGGHAGHNSNNGRNFRNNRRRRGNGGGQNGSGAPSGQQQQQQHSSWPSPHNPWAGTIQMWPGPLGRGLLGPRPPATLGQAPFAGAALVGQAGAAGGVPASHDDPARHSPGGLRCWPIWLGCTDRCGPCSTAVLLASFAADLEQQQQLDLGAYMGPARTGERVQHRLPDTAVFPRT